MGLETLAIVGIAMGAVGTAVSAYGSIAAGNAAKDAAEFEAQVAENDARAQSQQAAFDASRIRKRNKRLRGTQTTSALKSGFTMSGSNLDILQDSAIEGELDALTRLYTGAIGAGRSREGAKLARSKGKNAQRQGFMNAGGTALTGLAQGALTAANPQFKKN